MPKGRSRGDSPFTHEPSSSTSVFLGLGLLTFWLVFGTVGYVVLEDVSLLDGLYMTVITVSTVGFREVTPLSVPGRIFTIFLIMAGLATVFYTLTRLGQSIFEGELLDIVGKRRMKNEIAQLENHFIVCGFGKVARPVAEGLAHEGLPFCVIEHDPSSEDTLSNAGFLHLIADATEEQTLTEAGVERARCVLALLPHDADNLYLTMGARELNPGIRVIARASDQTGEVRLKRAGADEVVSPTRIAGLRVLQAAVNPTLVEFMEIVTQREALHLSMADIPISAGSELTGQTIAECGVRGRFGVIIVAIKRRGGMEFNPEPTHRITEDDTLVVLGEDVDIVQLQAVASG